MTGRQLAGAAVALLLVLGAMAALMFHFRVKPQTPSVSGDPPIAVAVDAEPAADESPLADDGLRASSADDDPRNHADTSGPSAAELKARYAASKKRLVADARKDARKKAAWDKELQRMDSGAYDEFVHRPQPAGSKATSKPAAKTKDGKKGPARAMLVVTTWCPRCDEIWPMIGQLSSQHKVGVQAFCVEEDEDVFAKWKSKHSAPFSVTRLSKAEATRRVASFGGSYSGSIPHLTVKSGREVVYDQSGAPRDTGAFLNRLLKRL
ncbi:MAG: thiol-disulfide isomerase/thioredoxin [Myxococcota bacterium]|jgi:thiol-disulfide isomerase/thioredoxin